MSRLDFSGQPTFLLAHETQRRAEDLGSEIAPNLIGAAATLACFYAAVGFQAAMYSYPDRPSLTLALMVATPAAVFWLRGIGRCVAYALEMRARRKELDRRIVGTRVLARH